MEVTRSTSPTILVVDDETDICLALSDLLGNEGYQVETVETGNEALRRVCLSHPYSAVILDLGLPDLDGLIVLQRLYSQDATLPVIILTAHGDQKEKIATLQHHAFAHLIKPYDRQEVIEMVHRAVAVKNLTRKAAQAQEALTSSETQHQLEQQRTHTLLSESEQRLNLALKAGNMGIWDWHIPSNTLIWSEEVSGIFGLVPGQFDGTNKAYMDCVHPEDRLLLKESFRKTVENDAPYEVEHRVVWPTGEVRWVACKGQVVENQEGLPQRMLGTVQDITTRKQAEIFVQDSQKFLTSIVDNLPHMIFVKHAKDLRFIRFNQAGEDLLGYPKESMIGKTDFDFFPKAEADFYNKKDREVLSGKTQVDIPEEVIQTKFQGTRYLHTKKIPILDDQGTPQYLLGISEDITEQKQAELERREREILLHLIFETGPGCIKRVAADGTLLHINPAGLELIEAENASEVLGRSVFDLVVPEHVDAFKQMHHEVIQGKKRTLQFEVQGTKGTRSWIETYAVPFKNPITNEVEHLAVTHDITKRKKSEEQAQQLSRQNELILSSAGDGIYGLDLEGRTTFVNPAGAKMLGYEPQELIGSFMHGIVHHSKPDGSPYPSKACPIYAVYSDGAIRQVQDEVLWRKDGTSFPVEYTSTPIWQDGNLAGAVVTFRDITERKESEDAFEQSRRDFLTLVNSLEGIVWECEFPSYRFTFVSQEAERLLGYSVDEWLGEPDFFCNRLHPSDQRRVVEYCREATLRKENHELEYRFLKKNGEEIWLRDLVTVVVEHDRPVKLRGVMFNITQTKLAEAILQESEERFRLLNEAIPQQVWTARPDGSLDYVNRRVLEYFGSSFEEMLGHGWQRFLHPDDLPGCLDCWARACETKQPYEIEFRLLRGTDNSFRWHLGRALPVLNPEGQVVKWFGSHTDITQLKQLENQVRQSQKMEAIGTLAGGIAHDFNNILMAIIGYTELAKQIVRENVSAQKNLDEVLVAGQRAKELVQQILTFSRQTEQSQQPLDLQPVVREVCKFLRATFPATIDIRQNFTEPTSIILGDPIQMHQVLMNLCANAEYAMRGSGGLLVLKLERVTGEPDGIGTHPDLHGGAYVRLTVQDTGSGMTSDIAQRIFDPFFTTKRVGEGTGMGLAVVHGIVISHGGVIRVESEPGQGTIFSLYFPEMEAASYPGEDKSVQQEVFMGRGHILLVEDEEPLARLEEEAMKGLGYEVMVRTSSVEALEAFRADPFRFDAVVTDQTMPHITGEALARQLLELRPDVPIILCTGFSHSMTSEKAKAMGIRAFLLKPLLIKDLARTLREVLHL
ncbi:MAG: PAS domain S-box protein [Nitrospira sp.]|nr:PAS domain S-box protein [Nitrospira sp.]